MTGKKQHVGIHRKLWLRRELLKQAAPGAVYVPFCGDGDIAAEVYADRKVFAADIDPERTALASKRLAGATIATADCDKWPFPDCSESFAVADFDSYTYPYDSFRAWWTQAKRRSPCVLFFTDGERQAMKRVNNYRTPDGEKHQGGTLAAWRPAFNAYWERIIFPWAKEAVAPWTIVTTLKYQRKDMLYWGMVIAEAAVADLPEIESPVGAVNRATILASLAEAAASGNVPAIIEWLKLHPEEPPDIVRGRAVVAKLVDSLFEGPDADPPA